jgi:protein arginine kinase
MPFDWFNSISSALPAWLPPLDNPAPQVVLSTTVTVARNIQGLVFPPFHGRADNAETAHLLAFQTLRNLPVFMNAAIFSVANLTAEQKRILENRRIAPRDFLSAPDYRTLLVTPDESIFARINNHNHLEIVLRERGNCPQQLVAHAMGLMKQLDDTVNFAKDDDYGYICRDFEQIGNGVSIQIATHLPGLELLGYIPQVTRGTRELNFLLEYDFPMQQKQDALFFSLKTRSAYSRNPLATAMRLEDYAKRLEGHELDARRVMVEGHRKGDLLDFIGRAKGLVFNAYRISLPEARRILSACWLGAETGFFPESTRSTAIQLLSTMEAEENKQDESAIALERRERRARELRDKLGPLLT